MMVMSATSATTSRVLPLVMTVVPTMLRPTSSMAVTTPEPLVMVLVMGAILAVGILAVTLGMTLAMATMPALMRTTMLVPRVATTIRPVTRLTTPLVTVNVLTSRTNASPTKVKAMTATTAVSVLTLPQKLP